MGNTEKFISKTTTRQWTKEAVFCLQRNLNCRNCTNYNLVCKENKCVMKAVVLELFKRFGKPDLARNWGSNYMVLPE